MVQDYIISQIDSYRKIQNICLNNLDSYEREAFTSLNRNGFIINVVPSDNGKFVTCYLPKRTQRVVFRKKRYSLFQITWLRQNGQVLVKNYDVLPRVTEFSDFEQHKYTEYVGCTNGYGWVITKSELVWFNKWYKETLF